MRRAGAFPVGDGTGPDPEERMRRWDLRDGAPGEDFRGAFRELGPKVPGFEPQLSRRYGDGRRSPFPGPDPGAVEPVAAPLRLVGHRVQIGSDGARGRGVLTESPELGVIPVTPSLSG